MAMECTGSLIFIAGKLGRRAAANQKKVREEIGKAKTATIPTMPCRAMTTEKVLRVFGQSRKLADDPEATVVHPRNGFGPTAYGQSQVDWVNAKPANQATDDADRRDHGDGGASLSNPDGGGRKEGKQKNPSDPSLLLSKERTPRPRRFVAGFRRKLPPCP